MTRKILVWSVLVSATIFSVACGDGSATVGSLQGNLVLQGTDDSAVTGYEIEFEGPSLAYAITRNDGTFVADQLAPGRYTVTANLGLFSQPANPSTEVTVVAGEVATASTITAAAAGTLSGRVTIDAGGDVADPSGVRIQVLGQPISALTDVAGAFILHRLPAGVHEVIAERTDLNVIRRAGIEVEPFVDNVMNDLVMSPGSDGPQNDPPVITGSIVATQGRSPAHEPRSLPYWLDSSETVPRFAWVALTVSAEDADGDPLSYHWSASSGTLSNALESTAFWRSDGTSGSLGTITVLVSDGHGGVSQASAEFSVVNVFSGDAHVDGGHLTHAYRVEGGPWNVDVLALPDSNDPSTDAPIITHRQTGISTAPRPFLTRPNSAELNVLWRQGNGFFGQPVPFSDYNIQIEISAVADSVRVPSVGAAGNKLWLLTALLDGVVSVELEYPNPTQSTLTCEGPCGGLYVSAGKLFVADQPGGSPRIQQQSQSLSQTFVTGPVGHGIAAINDGGFVYVRGGSSRSNRNSLARVDILSNESTVYEGYYDLVLWASDDDHIVFGEQEYLSLRHPPFLKVVRLSDGSISEIGRGGETWMIDRAYEVVGGRALVRLVAASDWPSPFDASRSQTAWVELEQTPMSAP